MKLTSFNISKVFWLADLGMFGGSVFVGLENDDETTGNAIEVIVRFKAHYDTPFAELEDRCLKNAISVLKEALDRIGADNPDSVRSRLAPP